MIGTSAQVYDEPTDDLAWMEHQRKARIGRYEAQTKPTTSITVKFQLDKLNIPTMLTFQGSKNHFSYPRDGQRRSSQKILLVYLL
jgi:hypothetical protein